MIEFVNFGVSAEIFNTFTALHVSKYVQGAKSSEKRLVSTFQSLNFGTRIFKFVFSGWISVVREVKWPLLSARCQDVSTNPEMEL